MKNMFVCVFAPKALNPLYLLRGVTIFGEEKLRFNYCSLNAKLSKKIIFIFVFLFFKTKLNCALK